MLCIFVDSGAFYALADRRDTAHARAWEFADAAKLSFLTTSLVFVETMSLVTKRMGKRLALELGNRILGSELIQIVHVDEGLQREAWRQFEAHADKGYDMVDCCSFAVMRRHGIVEAFAFDRHFAQAGFRVVPAL